MLKVTCYLLTVVLILLQVSRACQDNHDEEEQLAAARQQSDEYFAQAFGYTSNPWGSAYYQPSVPGNSKRNLKYLCETKKRISC